MHLMRKLSFTEHSWDCCSLEHRMETILTQWKNRTMSGTSLACNKLWLYKCKGVHILSWFPNIFEGEILFFFFKQHLWDYNARKHIWKRACLWKCSPINQCDLTQAQPSLAFLLTQIALWEMCYLSEGQKIHFHRLSSIHLLGTKAEPSDSFHASVYGTPPQFSFFF